MSTVHAQPHPFAHPKPYSLANPQPHAFTHPQPDTLTHPQPYTKPNTQSYPYPHPCAHVSKARVVLPAIESNYEFARQGFQSARCSCLPCLLESYVSYQV